MKNTDALLVVDVQNDFLPGGALAVPDGAAILPTVNALMAQFDCVIATQDWHPPGHESFASRHPGRRPGDVVDLHGIEQVLWPDHCEQGSPGASFAASLDVARFDAVVRKGQNPAVDSYSGFFDNDHRSPTGLDGLLLRRGIRRVFVCGLAADYCVRFTALDAVGLGFETVLITDATKAVNLAPGDRERAFDACSNAGVSLLASAELLPKEMSS